MARLGKGEQYLNVLPNINVQSCPRTIARANRQWLLIPAGKCWKRLNSIALRN